MARDIKKILILGNKNNTQLAILELKRGSVEIVGEIQFANNETTNLVPVIEINDKLSEIVHDVDTILVTDESNMVDILSALHSVNIPMDKITPLSFVVDEEV